jgi:multiple sugar transport system ATP-binding protein
MSSVLFDHVWKSYEAVEIVRDLNLDIAEGEFLVLVGPSGCGKSTTLRMLAGLEEVSRGDIRIGDRVVTNTEPRERDIAMVFQSYALYPHMTVEENIAFALKNRRVAPEVINRRVREATAMLEIDHLLERRPRHLSGGQRQRVALGRAIVRDPGVFLMDEPLSNLDAQLRVSMRSEIVKLHQRIGSTTVYVTHDQVEALTMGSRIAVLRQGRLMQVAPAEELYERPANVFVATFIGSPSMNMLSGRVVADGLAKFKSGNILLPLPQSLPSGLAERSAITLGIRPEHLVIRQQGSGGLPGTVSIVESTGDEAIVFIELADVVLQAKVRGRCRLRVGEAVEIHADPEEFHLFDAETEVRIPLPRDKRVQ